MKPIFLHIVAIACAASMLAACGSKKKSEPAPKETPAVVDEIAQKATGPVVTISSDLPHSLPGGAPNATLEQAAQFAWQEFIALNWPAKQNDNGTYQRDTPDPSALFGSGAASSNATKPPLVWETFRHKVEIYPGNGPPHGAELNGIPGSFTVRGYNDPPKYVYDSKFGNSGEIAACPDSDPALADITPWLNLDENTQIFLDTMFAGVGAQNSTKGEFLFLAKTNQVHFDYVLNPDNSGGALLDDAFWNHSFPDSATNLTNNPYYDQARYNFNQYLFNQITGKPSSLDGKIRVDFPANMVEMKTAWRQLTADEAKSGRFHLAPVRFYLETEDTKTYPGGICYKQEIWGMAALHIIQKTEDAPYFVFATFEQADNLLVPGPSGAPTPVEDADGKLIVADPGPPLATGLTAPTSVNIRPATPTTLEQYNTAAAPTNNAVNCDPGPRLYYENSTAQTVNSVPVTPQGKICVNQRSHPIPDVIQTVNKAAHDAIRAYNQQNKITDSPWEYYKLVNVQYKPLDKPAGALVYSEDEAENSSYFLSNSVVETNFNLQFFSGLLVATAPSFGQLISDYNPPNVGGWATEQTITVGDNKVTLTPLVLTGTAAQNQPFKNTYFLKDASGSDVQAFNMGGCMGCHGNAQFAGDDFSFILNVGLNSEPDTVGTDPTAKVKRFRLASPAPAK